MSRRSLVVTLLLLLLASSSAAAAEPAYRVGSATNRLALLPVRCERDLDPSLCAALGESIAVEAGREPRIEVVNPRDIDVLLGAQTVADLTSCEKDDCFARQDLTNIDASYLIALSVGRIGEEARLVLRMVDLKRGAVIDRDDAAARADDERAIERAARTLTMGVLIRRGLARAPALAEAERPLGGVFWAGLVSTGVGAVAVGAGTFFGATAVSEAQRLAGDADRLTRDEFDSRADGPRNSAATADLLFAAGGAFVVTGAIMMIAGAL